MKLGVGLFTHLYIFRLDFGYGLWMVLDVDYRVKGGGKGPIWKYDERLGNPTCRWVLP